MRAEISIFGAEGTWQRFRDTAELAIKIGRLQSYLEEVDPESPAEVIDALPIMTDIFEAEFPHTNSLIRDQKDMTTPDL